MTTAVAETTIEEYCDPRAIARLLTRAAGLRAPFRLSSPGRADSDQLTGVVIAVDDTSMTLEIHDGTDHITTCCEHEPLTLELGLPQGRVDCEVRCTSAWHCEKSSTIVVANPTTMKLIERRHNSRRRLRPASRVIVVSTASSRPIEATGSLLNLSLTGVACLFATTDVSSATPGLAVAIQISLSTSTPPLPLNARVISVTASGSTDQAVIGMEFIDDDALCAARPTLQAALCGDDLDRGVG